MVTIQVEEISAAKMAAAEGAKIIGKNPRGGILLVSGVPYALKYPYHRYTQNKEHPWGHPDGGYTNADMSRVHMHLDIPQKEQTTEVVGRWLEQMKEGVIPIGATQGVEVEGVVYEGNSTRLAPAYSDASKNQHPELMETTLETATGTLPNGSYPNTPVTVAQQISLAIREAHEHADLNGNRVVHTSVPEGGSVDQNKNTPVPYLEAFAPRVLADTILHGGEIPQEVKSLYAKIGIPDVLQYLENTGVLNWPVHALHVHNGVPMIGEYADTRSAYAMAQVRNTEMAKIVSFMLYNTQYCYGVNAGDKDVRSKMRRLLSTTHGGETPQSAEEYVQKAVQALEDGSIHSLPRYPAHSQHDRTRIRMDGVTMESIDAPMNPDLRLVLGWTYINQIMNVIALDTLQQTGGDESQVLAHLGSQWGELMKPINAMGEEHSSYSHDLIFNKDGYTGHAPWMKKNYADSIQDIISLFELYGNKYPAITTYVAIVKRLLTDSIKPKNIATLEEYFGVENGVYQANGKNHGLVTDAKQNYPVEKMIDIQSKATRLQAEALSQIQSDSELLQFFGISQDIHSV
ncbi:MAG: hypothetical protein NTZ55_01930 [Candidatus Roizmanbacteria bacterium]|nr:hypothetical protein [Candidatus Roizmanbacteria bacterium]